MILKIGVILGFFSVFLVSKDLLFPFITTKQIYFNILIELLAVFWLSFIIKYPSYNPFNNKNRSLISFGLIAYFAAILLSCFFGVDFNLSYWGDIERMLGFFHLVHFLLFYFIIITAFKTWKDWKILYLISIVCAILISVIGLAGNPYSTIGNTAYVAGYLIFNIYFCFFLFAKEKIKNLKWVYLLPFLFILPAFVRADSSGGYVGLGFSIIVLFFLAGVLADSKKIKRATWSVLILLILLLTVLFSLRNAEFAQNSAFFRPLQEISLQKNTFQTRLISWRAALKDFPNHPILGTGYGNYAITFDKYFEPKFYSYTSSETYFDRAHNNIIDIASTTGLLGLFTYLSIFIFTAYYLVRGYFSKKIKTADFVLVVGLIAAYFVQNLAVFDSLVTYMSLMILLGYVYWLYHGEEEGEREQDRGLDNSEIFTYLIVGVVSLFIVFHYNVRVLKMLRYTIDGQVAAAKEDANGMYEAYKKAMEFKTPLDRDSRTSLIRAIASNPQLLAKAKPETAKEILDFVIELSEKNLKYNQKDSLNLLLHAQLLDFTAEAYKNNTDKFKYYSDESLAVVNRAIESSPGRINIYYFLAQIHITRNEPEKAVEAMRYAVSLNPEYIESTCQLAKIYFSFGDEENGYKEMDKCLDNKGANHINTKGLAVNLINHYNELGDAEKLLALYESLVKIEKNDPQIWVNLAQLYKQAGNKEKAIEAAQKAAEINPSLKNSVDGFIRELE